LYARQYAQYPAHPLEGVEPDLCYCERYAVQDGIAIFTILLSGGVSFITAGLSQNRQQRRATENYKLALVSEIRALHKHLIRYETEFNEQVLTGRATPAQVLKVLIQPGDTIVFTNNASAIGLFDNQTALRVLRFYSDVRALHGHALVLSELASDQGYENHQAMLRHARRRAHALVERLKRPDLLAFAVVLLSRRFRELRRFTRMRPADPLREAMNAARSPSARQGYRI
jgi:hypothetical protein